MGISNVKTSRDLSSAIWYMSSDKAHDGSSNRYISSRFVNCTEYGAIQQTKAVREYFGKDKNIHGLTFVFSFSDKEIGLFDRDKQELIMDHLTEVLKERFPNRQIGLYAQVDGKGQKFHIHGFVNSPDLQTGKLLDGRVKLHEHTREMLSIAMERAGIEDENKNAPTKQAVKSNIAMIKVKEKDPNKYIWMEDLQNRIKSVLNDVSVTNPKEFSAKLAENGIDYKVRNSKKSKSGKALSYAFLDKDGKERRVRASRIGTDFQIESINQVLKNHIKELAERKAEAERKAREVERRKVEQVRHGESSLDGLNINDILGDSSDISLKRSKIDSKPVVPVRELKPLRKEENGSQSLSEARRTILENELEYNSSESKKSNTGRSVHSEPLLENPFLKYIKTNRFIMWQESGRPFPMLGNEKRTFEEHANIRARRVLNDRELLAFAEKIPFTIPSENYQGKLICNTKEITLRERFEKSESNKDLLSRYENYEAERAITKTNVLDHTVDY